MSDYSLTITSSGGLIEVSYNDLFPLMSDDKESCFAKACIEFLHLRSDCVEVNLHGNTVYRVCVIDTPDWERNKYSPIGSIDGIEPTSLADLYSKIKSFMI